MFTIFAISVVKMGRYWSQKLRHHGNRFSQSQHEGGWRALML